MITLYKGNTFAKNIVLENYELKPIDVLKIGIKKRIGDEDYLLPVQELTNLTTTFEYSAEQTANLVPDVYILEIQLQYANGKVATLKQEKLKVEGVVIDE